MTHSHNTQLTKVYLLSSNIYTFSLEIFYNNLYSPQFKDKRANR